MPKTNAELIKELRDTVSFSKFGIAGQVVHEFEPLIDDIAERLGVLKTYEVWVPPKVIKVDGITHQREMRLLGNIKANDIDDARVRAKQGFRHHLIGEGECDFAVVPLALD